MPNAIRAIHPYRHQGLWVFDDAAAGLTREPCVAGADGILDRLAAAIPGAAGGFTPCDKRLMPVQGWCQWITFQFALEGVKELPFGAQIVK